MTLINNLIKPYPPEKETLDACWCQTGAPPARSWSVIVGMADDTVRPYRGIGIRYVWKRCDTWVPICLQAHRHHPSLFYAGAADHYDAIRVPTGRYTIIGVASGKKKGKGVPALAVEYCMYYLEGEALGGSQSPIA